MKSPLTLILESSVIARNAYKLLPLVILVAGLSRGVGRGKSLFGFSYAVSVQTEINNYARRISQDSALGDAVPTPESFPDWVRANFKKADNVNRDQAIDLWGTPYVLRIEGQAARIVSAGPDKTFDTPDDLVAEALITR